MYEAEGLDVIRKENVRFRTRTDRADSLREFVSHRLSGRVNDILGPEQHVVAAVLNGLDERSVFVWVELSRSAGYLHPALDLPHTRS